MDERAKRFRAAVRSRNDGDCRRRRFGADLRAEAVAYARRRRSEGASWRTVSSELEIGESLLQRWLKGAPSFARVEVTEPSLSAPVRGGEDVRVRTASGHEVSGLNVESAARLLRLLS